MCYGWCEKRDNDSDKAVCVSNPWNVCVIQCCSVTGLYVCMYVVEVSRLLHLSNEEIVIYAIVAYKQCFL